MIPATNAANLIGNLLPANGTGTPSSRGVGAPHSSDAFSGVMQRAMSDVSALEKDASAKVHGLLGGTGVDVHAAMIATERADMAFELTLAVRNKAVAAYQQLNGMQF